MKEYCVPKYIIHHKYCEDCCIYDYIKCSGHLDFCHKPKGVVNMKKYYISGEHEGKPLHLGVIKALRDIFRLDTESEEIDKKYQEWAESLSNIAHEADRQLFFQKLQEFGPFKKNRFEKNTYAKETERFKILVKKDFCDQKVVVKFFNEGTMVKESNFENVDEFLKSNGWKEK